MCKSVSKKKIRKTNVTYSYSTIGHGMCELFGGTRDNNNNNNNNK